MNLSKILIVDDDPAQIEYCQNVFNAMKVEITSASSGEEALAWLNKEPFDVIITDLVMPGMSGLDLLVAIQKRGYSIPVIIMTGYPDLENVEACVNLGSFDYIAKPYSPELLQATVQRALVKSGKVPIIEDQQSKTVKSRFPNIIGYSKAMEEIFDKVSKVAKSNANVCIYGESGTGKELIARIIHYHSPRKNRPLITLDCTAIPEGLMESEMFGHVKGAFTSAYTEREGVFELAHTGTLFLDEIGELSLPLQAKLLRVLQCREFRKVGGTKPIRTDVRIISATNKDLRTAVLEGRFCEDLYYRVDVIPIPLPPLRERKEDIPFLVDFFIEKFNQVHAKEIKGLHPRALKTLLQYDWPGNVRELENCIERAVVMADGPWIDSPDFSLLSKNEASNLHHSSNGKASLSLREMEKEHILRVLHEVEGNRTKAAKLLGISLRGLQYKLKALSITV